MTSILRAAAQNLRAYYAAYARLHERRELLNRPWEEEFLHYALDGKLHGHLLPPEQSRPQCHLRRVVPRLGAAVAHRADLE